MVAHSLTVALALFLQAGAAQRSDGKVLQATAARAYLDAGADDGLAPGADVIFHRAGAEVGHCKLEEVAARSAACAVRGVRAGDSFPLPGRAAQEGPKLLPPPTAPEAIEAQARLVAAAPIATVEYKAKPRPEQPRRAPLAAVELAEVAWVSTSASAFTGTRASVGLRDAEIGFGLRANLDAQAIRWSSRPDPRFRPKDDSQLYIWQAAVSRDPGLDGAALSVGRVMAWRIPGATILDGAVAGWRLPWLEVGAFGGLVPDPSTLALATDRSTGGGYWVLDHAISKGFAIHDEGRLAVVATPELGTRFEAETMAAARMGRAFDLTGSVRLGFGGDVQAPGSVDAARLELSVRPVTHLRLAGWLAYDGLEAPVDAEPMVHPGHSRRAEASATWSQGGAVRVTLLGGAAKDLQTGLDRSWVGPVVDLPRLLFARGGLSLGYLEELGWSDGRSAWIQAVARPWSRLRLLGRLSWSHASALAVMQDEFGIALSAVADLTRGFSARLSVATRGAFTGGEGGSTEGGATIFATVAARY
jgi:hypothetical protein